MSVVCIMRVVHAGHAHHARCPHKTCVLWVLCAQDAHIMHNVSAGRAHRAPTTMPLYLAIVLLRAFIGRVYTNAQGTQSWHNNSAHYLVVGMPAPKGLGCGTITLHITRLWVCQLARDTRSWGTSSAHICLVPHLS